MHRKLLVDKFNVCTNQYNDSLYLLQDLDRKVTMSDDYFSLMEFQACFEAMETDPPQKQVHYTRLSVCTLILNVQVHGVWLKFWKMSIILNKT